MLLNTHVRSSIAEPSIRLQLRSEIRPTSRTPCVLKARAVGGLQLPWVPRRIKSSRTCFPTVAVGLRTQADAYDGGRQCFTPRARLYGTVEDTRWLRDNESLIYSDIAAIASDLKLLHRRLPHVHTPLNGENIPRILAVVMGFLKATGYHFSEQTFSSFFIGFQEGLPSRTAQEFKAVWFQL